MTTTKGHAGLVAAGEGLFELGDGRDLDGLGAHRLRVGGEVDAAVGAAPGMGEEVVELGPAGGHLEAVDAAVAAVVGDDDREGQAHHGGGRELAVQHHVAAVAQHADHVAVGLGHLDAEAPRDLVAHAGEAVFGVVGHGRGGAPELVELARHGAGGVHDHRVGPAARWTAPMTWLSVGRRWRRARARR
jgi:hypothetical protein